MLPKVLMLMTTKALMLRPTKALILKKAISLCLSSPPVTYKACSEAAPGSDSGFGIEFQNGAL
jgi:hypothetical protein